MFPSRRGQVTGLRAILSAVVIVGFIAFGAYRKFMPRSIGDGTWNIEPDAAMFFEVKASKPGRLKAEFKPETPAAQYSAYIVDEATKNKLEKDPASDLSTVSKISELHGQTALTFEQVSIGQGNFYIIVANEGKTNLTVKYQVYELRGN